jgi:hypothetical protein
MRRHLLATAAVALMAVLGPATAGASHGSAVCSGVVGAPAVPVVATPLVGPVLLLQAVHEAQRLAARGHCH